MAGIADIKKTIEDPYSCYQVNCFGTLNALELAAKKGVKRVSSTPRRANVYGAPKKNPVTEEHAMDPRVPYDYSKVVGENLAMSYFKTKGVPVAMTRAWLLFGEFDHPSRAVPFFIRTLPEERARQALQLGKGRDGPLARGELREAGGEDPGEGRGSRAGFQLRGRGDAARYASSPRGSSA